MIRFLLRRKIINDIPEDVKYILKQYPEGMFIGGGFLRDIKLGEDPRDIDLFLSPDVKSYIKLITADLEIRGYSSFTTDNAITFTKKGEVKIQIILGWTYNDVISMYKDFDFTINQIGCYWDGIKYIIKSSKEFDIDIKKKILVYTKPIRKELSINTAWRMTKFLSRGYTIDRDNLNKVLARSVSYTYNDLEDNYCPNYVAEKKIYTRLTTTTEKTRGSGGY